MPAGYSGTPLARKLGIKEGFSIWLQDAPAHYFDLFADLPKEIDVRTEADDESLDFIHVFVREEDRLVEYLERLKPLLKKNGSFWISWPKGSSKIKTNLKREPIRELGLAAGLVDVKVAAIDADWSGLKFVYRLVDR